MDKKKYIETCVIKKDIIRIIHIEYLNKPEIKKLNAKLIPNPKRIANPKNFNGSVLISVYLSKLEYFSLTFFGYRYENNLYIFTSKQTRPY